MQFTVDTCPSFLVISALAIEIRKGVSQAMQVILREDIEKLGKIGDLVKVKEGFGRNFLIPKKKAIEATPKNVKAMDHAKKMVADRLRKLKKEAAADAENIKALALTIKAKVGEEGKLFGSVTSMDIAEAAAAQGVRIDKRKIQLEEPIKRVGEFAVPVKLHADVTADLKVTVIAEEQ
jgi:large subunit ribosomal protein L9